MKKVVLDSSVIIKWFFSKNEKQVSRAKLLRDDFVNSKIKAYLPQLFFYEFINVSVVSKKAPPSMVLEAISSILRLSFIFGENNKKSLARIMFYTSKYNISAYDAAYIALAKEKRAIFITADQKLVNKVKLDFVKNLKEIL